MRYILALSLAGVIVVAVVSPTRPHLLTSDEARSVVGSQVNNKICNVGTSDCDVFNSTQIDGTSPCLFSFHAGEDCTVCGTVATWDTCVTSAGNNCTVGPGNDCGRRFVGQCDSTGLVCDDLTEEGFCENAPSC